MLWKLLKEKTIQGRKLFEEIRYAFEELAEIYDVVQPNKAFLKFIMTCQHFNMKQIKSVAFKNIIII